MTKENFRLITILGFLVAASVFIAGSVLAQGPPGGERPGYGYGDQNHTHIGPPGQSVRPAK